MKKMLLMIMVMCLLPVTAWAQDWAERAPDIDMGTWEVRLGGSGFNDDSFEAGGFSVDAALGMYLNEYLLVEGRQNINYNDTGSRTDWKGTTRAAVDWHFTDSAFRPFIGAHLGYFYGDQVDETWEAGPEAGIKLYLMPETFVYATAEYQVFFEDTDDVNDNFEDGQFVYGLGFGINF